MSEDMLEREIGESIENVRTHAGAKNCPAHPYMADAVVKSMRLHERTYRLQKWAIGMLLAILCSLWLRGADVGDIITIIKGVLVKDVSAQVVAK